MRKMMLSIGLFLAGHTAISQDTTRSGDSVIVYIRGLPVTGERGDSVEDFPQEDIAPKDHLVKVSHTAIPQLLLEALQQGEEYRGWEHSPVYYDKNTDLYILHIYKGDNIHTYKLNDNGKPVSVNVSRAGPEE